MSKWKDFLISVFSPTGEAAAPKPEKKNEPGETGSSLEPEVNTDAPVETPESQPLGSFVDFQDVQDTISDCLLQEMKLYRGGSGYPSLTIWMDDPIALQLTTPLFQERLKKDLLHAGCRPQSQKTSVTVREGTPPSGMAVVSLSKKGKLNPGKVFLTFLQEGVAAKKAELSVCMGKGSLATDPFVIDPSVKSRYRIGRGETSSRPDYSYRINDIVIRTDDPDPDVQELNNHVSSAHADLVCRDDRFYLQVMPAGSPAGGNSTRIVRDQTPVLLDQMGVDYPLNDGDLIELGQSVLLVFKLKA